MNGTPQTTPNYSSKKVVRRPAPNVRVPPYHLTCCMQQVRPPYLLYVGNWGPTF